jgi:hypothetical protein
MLSTGSLKDAQLLPSSDSNVFSLVAANGRAMVKSKNGVVLPLYKIADCARTAFRPRKIPIPQQRGNAI